MKDYKLTVGIEPTDEYENAKQDLLKAYKSISSLSEEEKRKLVCEVARITGCDIAFNSH